MVFVYIVLFSEKGICYNNTALVKHIFLFDKRFGRIEIYTSANLLIVDQDLCTICTIYKIKVSRKKFF